MQARMRLPRWALLPAVLIVLLSPLIWQAPHAEAAIAIDNEASSGLFSSGGSFSYSITGSTNTLLIVHVVSLNSGQPTGCTFNGVAMTQVRAPQTNSDTSAMAMYYMAGATGTHSISCTAVTGGANMIAIAVSYTGVNQASPIDSSNNNATVTAKPQTYCTTVVASGAWLVENNYSDANAAVAGTGAFLRQQGSNITIAAFDSNGTVGTGSQCMTITTAGGGADFAMVIASIAPAASAAPIFQLWPFSLF